MSLHFNKVYRLLHVWDFWYDWTNVSLGVEIWNVSSNKQKYAQMYQEENELELDSSDKPRRHKIDVKWIFNYIDFSLTYTAVFFFEMPNIFFKNRHSFKIPKNQNPERSKSWKLKILKAQNLESSKSRTLKIPTYSKSRHTQNPDILKISGENWNDE